MTVLCVICAEREPAPVVCQRCEDRMRRDLDDIGRDRLRIRDWTQIDPGTPGRDTRHLLALIDNPAITHDGQPDLTVIAATDRRSRRIIAGWHDTECGDTGCADPGCADPAHRQDPADDVVSVDHELITEARLIAEARHLAAPIRDVFDALRVLTMSRDWSARSDRVDEHAAVLADCAAALRLILRDTRDRVVGTCTAAHPDRDTCGGPLRLAWLGPLPLTPEDQVRPTHMACGWCGDPWPLDALTLVAMLRVVEPTSLPVARSWVVGEGIVDARRLRQWIWRGQVRTYRDGSMVDLADIVPRLDTPTASGLDIARNV